MRSKIDPRIHIGEQYGVFIIEDVLPEKDKYGHWIYKGVCQECGYVKFAHYGKFKNPIIDQCHHLDKSSQYRHYGTYWVNDRICKIFNGMKRRCYDSNDKNYNRYGERGIKICDEWLQNPKSFESWALAHGYDDDLTIDRIDEDKDYCPENCEWIPNEINAKYKSTTRVLDVDGEVHTGKDWAKRLSLGINQINNYVRKYGEENTIEFIRRVLAKPELRINSRYYYDVYMNDISFTT